MDTWSPRHCSIPNHQGHHSSVQPRDKKEGTSAKVVHNDMAKPVEAGGFEYAYSDNGKLLISDTMLRSLLPKELRRMTYKNIEVVEGNCSRRTIQHRKAKCTECRYLV
mmetsp:Transcript_12319/g.22382  ORF Transcript_12319/g.22382 Transcript_12319/m.22382 type:complete len:108 (+) Transcript_12319:729-1052(+)